MTRSRERCSVGLAAVLLLASARLAAMPCPPQLGPELAARPANALEGRAFIASVAELEPEAREAAIVAEILRGNVPSFLRMLVPVVVHAAPGPGRTKPVAATLCVVPDYLAIGSDDDFVHMPMNLRSATKIARELGFVLPTEKIVDAIHEQAAYRFKPQPLAPGSRMTLPEYFLAHERRILTEAIGEKAPFRGLVAGHKKDIVLTNLLNRRSGRIAIYGWHYRDGTPIQPLSTAHHAGYADYSHGVRLVSEVVTIQGRRHSIYDVLEDNRRAGLLSSEGPIRNPRALMGIRSAAIARAF